MKRLLWHQFFVATPVKGFHGVATKNRCQSNRLKSPFLFSYPYFSDRHLRKTWMMGRQETAMAQWSHPSFPAANILKRNPLILLARAPRASNGACELRGFSQIPRGRIPSSPVPHGSSCHIAAGHTLQAGIYQPLGGPHEWYNMILIWYSHVMYDLGVLLVRVIRQLSY